MRSNTIIPALEMVQTDRKKSRKKKRNLLANRCKCAFESKQDKNLVDMRRFVCHERQDVPYNIARDKNPFRPDKRQCARRRNLENGVCDEVNGVHVVEVLALEIEIFAHAANVRAAIAGLVDAEEEPDQGKVREQGKIQLNDQAALR